MPRTPARRLAALGLGLALAGLAALPARATPIPTTPLPETPVPQAAAAWAAPPVRAVARPAPRPADPPGTESLWFVGVFQ
jgi:hypothetical protein